MKKILVPVDFSEHSEYALEAAVKIAQTQNAEVIALHMMGISEAVISKNNPKEAFEALYYSKLVEKKFIEFLDKDFLEGIHIEQAVCNYNQFTEINNLAKKYEADLIVMGSHGSSGISEIFVGSNTEKVVRTSEIPVLVIKNKHESFTVSDFVFASDFKNDNKDTYKQAIKLAELFDARMHLLMVNTMSNFTTTATAKVRIHEFIEGNTFTNYTTNIYNDESVEKGILNFSEIINADLIGISTHGRQGISHFLSGSISEDLVNHANRPVITFKI